MKKKLPKVKNKLFESVTGTIRFTLTHPDGSKTVFPETHNLITDEFRRVLFQLTDSSSATPQVLYDRVRLVCGRGTTAPQKTDLALTSPYNWGNISGSTNSYAEILTRHTGIICFSFIVPADSAYVGTITEVGLITDISIRYKNTNNAWQGRSGYIVTHSLLKDSEGNPYTVNKTAIDQLTVEYIIHINSNLLELPTFLITDTITNKQIAGRATYPGLIGFRGFNISKGDVTSSMPLIRLIKKWSAAKIIGNFIYSRRDDSTTYFQVSTINDWATPTTLVIRQGNSTSGYSDTSYVLSTMSDDTDTKNYPVRRVRSNWAFNGRYYFGYIFSPLWEETINQKYMYTVWFVKRFVEDLNMPAQALPIKAIGTGDGSTTEFIPPYDYWKENTEKIYINGVLQTRGVDYTCDNFANYNDVPELLPLVHATIIDADWFTNDDSSNICFAVKSSSHYEHDHEDHVLILTPKSKKLLYITGNTPMYYDEQIYWTGSLKMPKKWKASNATMTEDDIFYYALFTERKGIVFELPLDDINLPFKVNTLYLVQMQDSRAKRPLFTVSCSDDNNTWTTVLSDITAYNNNYDEPYNRSKEDWLEYPLGQEYTKRYWKFEMRIDPNDSGTINYIPRLGICLKHKGQNIIFTNPPAAGASITMEADTDILYKDTHNVIDIGETVTFSS